MSELNLDQARFNMIEQQVRPWDVMDQQVLDLMSKLTRENFVPDTYRDLAYADIDVPVADNQIMLAPKFVARLLQGLQVQAEESILEIGTGSGYLTALLAQLGKQVDSVDVRSDFTEQASNRLNALNIENVSLSTGDAINGWNTDKKYDVIVLTGSVPVLKSHFQQQLNVGGRLFAFVGQAPVMQACVITRLSADSFSTDILFENLIPALDGAPEPEAFVL